MNCAENLPPITHTIKVFILTKVGFLGLVLILNGCGAYSFSGAAISSDVESVTIENFPNQASLREPTLSQTFTQKLRDRFLRDTRLKQVDNNGDLHFSGHITRYSVSSEGIQSNERAGRTRLTIEVKVNYRNALNEDENFEQTFSAYENFSSDQQLSAVQGRLIDDITDQIIQDIFNATVNNW